MKIAWLCPYPVSQLDHLLDGGVRRFSIHPCSWIMNLSDALSGISGVELHMVTLTPWVARSQVVQRNGIFVHVIKNGIPLTQRGWPSYLPVDILTGFWRDIRLLRQEIRKINPDVIHAHGTENAYALATVGQRIPAMVSIQGIVSKIAQVNPTFRYRVVSRFERRALKKMAYASCRTDFDTGFVRSVNASIHIFQIHEAMNPVYFKQQWKGCERKRILFVGSMGKHKGLDFLLQAVSRLAKDNPEISLTVVGGTAGEIESCKGRCNELGILHCVEFKGFLPADQIAQLHQSSRVFVIPSTNENSPNALAEAMVSGMPCIASAVGGIPSMIKAGETGLLFESGNIDELINHLKTTLYDDELCIRIGQAAAGTSRSRHDPKLVANATLDAYNHMLTAC